MEVRYTVGKNEYSRMNTQELRESFLIDSLFNKDEIHLIYCEVERSIVGSAVPTAAALKLEAGKELSSDYFCDRRELGVLNIGKSGAVVVDGETFHLDRLDGLYIGRGAQEISFTSESEADPAKFYFVSYPAHASYPTTQIARSSANPLRLGSQETSNQRTIYQYIHEAGVQSCQLVMGYTELEQGSVWNTMPPHTHERRTEVYMYFDMPDDAAVFHLMGPSDETRHLTMQSGSAVISPMWSLHSGCGTQSYSFCWAMGGENQAFHDMDGIPVNELK